MTKTTTTSKLIAVMLAVCTLLCCIPTAYAEDAPQKVFGKQIVVPKNIMAFENDYKGYLTTITDIDGRTARLISRTGSDDTAFNFCMYRWGMFEDGEGNYVPLSTAKYLVIDYLYQSPDAKPALEGNRVKWIQGRIVAADNTSKIIEFGWNNALYSEKGMVANKWDKLVVPLAADEALAEMIEQSYSSKEYYLHQIKLFPLERDMGKEDKLYFGDISIQSWHPEKDPGFVERTVSYYASNKDAAAGSNAIGTAKHKDMASFTVPKYMGTLPANSEFRCWINTLDGKEYYPDDTFEMVFGKDITFVADFNYLFDFVSNETSYISGYPDGTFKPENSVTRAEAVKIIASIVNPTNAAMGECTFADVAADAWYRPYAATLESLGALDVFDGEFKADQPITRSELVEIIYAVSDTNMQSIRLEYVSDVDPEEDYYDAVMFAVATGIIAGYPDGTFKPDNKITRAETVTIVNRMLGRTANAGAASTKFSDVSGHWAEGQVISASSAKAENLWTATAAKKEYVLTGSSAEEYIKALHEQGKTLTGDAIRRGIDTIAEQMKKDILNTPNTEEIYGPFKNVYYVSEKNGNDENNGKTPETAVKTINGLSKKLRFPGKGTAVLFERGGIYRGQISVTSGVTYGSYGTGDKPIISASVKNYADPSLWVETDAKGVYELTDKITNVGFIVFDHAPDAHGNYNDLYGKNRIYGANIIDYKGLTKDLEFFSCNDTLYLCSKEGNPGQRFKSIELAGRIDIFDGSGSNIVIDNLHVKHTGAHGIGMGSVNNLTVTNCEFSWLGGSLLGNYGQTTTQYGNAVEVYGNINGYYVRNNWMYQIYDTAVTHQGKDLRMDGIEYSGNLMEYCHWGIECWITPENQNNTLLKNYLAKYNVLRNGGYGWGSIVTNRMSHARLYSFSTVDAENENLHSEFNIIDRCAGYLLDIDKRSCETFDSNIYVQDEGKTLGGLKNKSTSTTKYGAIDIYENLGDENQIFVFIPKR